MIAGINGSEALILLVITLIVVGPERLPRYAAQLAKFIRGVRKMLGEAQEKVRDELGPEGEEIPWDKLDPRQYDPRRIVRDAVFNDDSEAATGSGTFRGASRGEASAGGVASAATAMKVTSREPGVPPPFDDEAT